MKTAVGAATPPPGREFVPTPPCFVLQVGSVPVVWLNANDRVRYQEWKRRRRDARV